MENPIQTTFSIKTTFLSLSILLFCCFIAFWPLTFHVFSLKNDALNYFLPVRYQISEAISKGYWPFWSPYFNLGYPLHGDMQSGVWNPFVQIISLFGPYTLKTLQYETLLYIYLSGVGMFFLVRYFFKDWRVCLFGATAFMLCGFNSDSAQFLNWISSASFLPLVFLFYYRTLIEKSWRTALYCGFFLFLLFTTAYPADFILTAYLLLFILIWHTLKKENRRRQILWQQIKLHAGIVISFVLLSLPAIISYAEFLPLSERGTGASYNEVMSNPLHPSLIFSYLTPLPIWRASFAAITDPLTRNCFFGFISFGFLLLSFFIRSNYSLIRFFKWAFFLSILFSFGEIGGLRVFSYYALPLMNTFRHPANARLFSIFFGCLLAAFAFKEAIQVRISFSAKKNTWLILLFSVGAMVIWAIVTNQISFFYLFNQSPKTLLDKLNFSDLLIINIFIQIPFLLILYYAFVKKINCKILLIASVFNCVIHSILFQPFTVVKKDSVSYIQGILNNVQQPGYPLPQLSVSLSENSKNGELFFKEIGAANLYSKRIGRINYRITPSNLLTQNEFWFNEKLRDIFLQYPLLYKVDSAISITDSVLAVHKTAKRFAIVEDPQIKKAINENPSSSYTASIKKFTPNFWEVEIESAQPNYYSIFQNQYPRWQLLVDGKNHPLQQCNISFMGFQLSAGKHVVSFHYKSTDLKFAFFVSLGSLFVIFISLFYKNTKLSFLS